jgi:(S)-ureidoglycine aminohydrolase
MQHLGHTRSGYQRDHVVLTPDTFVRAALPGMRNAVAIVHASPQIGAGFTQYTVEFDKPGSMPLGSAQTFLYVHSGVVGVTIGKKEHWLSADQYAYLPPGCGARIECPDGGRATVIEKNWVPLGAHKLPKFFVNDEREVTPQPLLGDEALAVRSLMPADFAYDFAVNTMTFQLGATLPMAEIHCMEHGLLMLQGEGIYRLNEHWYPVAAGDFIWMAPYCPQWFGCLGKAPAKYLIYKDWNRHPLNPK